MDNIQVVKVTTLRIEQKPLVLYLLCVSSISIESRTKYTGLQSQLTIFRKLFLRNRKFLVNVCFKTSEHRVQTVEIKAEEEMEKSTQVGLFLMTGEAGIVNVQSCGMHWYLN